MEFGLSEEQKLLCSAASRFSTERCRLDTRQAVIASGQAFSKDLWQEIAQMGWLGLALPEDVGGLDLSVVEIALLMEQLGGAMILEPLIPTAFLCCRIIEQSHDWPQREQRLRSSCDGELPMALAHEEPLERYSGARLVTRAERTAAGYRLSGAKSPVFWGGGAEAFIVSAMEPGARAPSLFFVPRSTSGLESRSYRLIDGSSACDLLLHDVALASDSRIAGGEGASEAILRHGLDCATVAIVAEGLGTMEAVLQVTGDYVKTRRQFGKPIGAFQSLQHILSDMFVEAQQVRSVLYHALAMWDAAPEQRSRAVSAAKTLAGEAARTVGYGGVQLHGANGMTEEYPVGHMFRRLVVFEKMFGDTEVHFRRFMTAV